MQGFPEYDEIVALRQAGTKDLWVFLSKKYGVDKENIRGWFRRETERRAKEADDIMNELPETPDLPPLDNSNTDEGRMKAETATSFDNEGNVKFISSRRLIEMDAEQEKDVNFVLEAHGFKPSEWTLVNVLNNYWQTPRPKDAGAATLFQSKVTVKPKEASNKLTIEDIDKYFAMFNSPVSSVPYILHKQKNTGKVLEINLADIHVGNDRLSFQEVRERLEHVFYDISFKLSKYDFEKVIVVEIGDILHFDTFGKTTTSGTNIDTKNTSYEIFDAGADLMIWFLENLSNLLPVEYIKLNGNHDRVMGYGLAKSIEFYFRNNPNIKFDNSHKERKYRVIGNTVVGWCHGDISYKNLKNVLQTEARKEYGITDFAEMHVGHVHHELVKDEGSVIVRYLSSLTAPDTWHVKEGYVGAKQGAMSFVWSNNGLEEIWYTGVPTEE